MNKKILVLGASGMLGNAIYRYLSEQPNLSVFGTIRNSSNRKYFSDNLHEHLFPNVDVLHQDDLIHLLKQLKPDVIINCVGIIKQLSESKDPLAVLPINSMLPHRLAHLADLINARVIHISTDCVFAGTKGLYTENDDCDATDLYGVSKKIGELSEYQNAITLRTSIIGRELNTNYALIDWFLSQQHSIKGYKHAVFSGLPTVELARVIHDYVIPNPQLSGLYHVSSEPIDKYSLLKLVAEVYGKKIDIIPDEHFKINRSLNSGRFKQITGYKPPSWPELVLKMKNFE